MAIAGATAAARRAGRLGNGFYPLGVGPERLAVLRRTMEEVAREHGRDPAQIEITCVGEPTAKSAELYAGQGVDRMIFFPREGDLDALHRSLDAFRREVAERFA